MTEKQQSILKAALELFAREGYHATSTNKVAKTAGVSEGLIFRHFQNKEGLLRAILNEGEEKAKELFEDIVMEQNAREVVAKTLDLPYKVMSNPETANFWKLQYKLKWELEVYGEQKMEPLKHVLVNALLELDFENTEEEADLILTFIDGLAMRFYLQEGFDVEKVLNHLKMKYL
jgi:AcrR family transcriptional regulator